MSESRLIRTGIAATGGTRVVDGQGVWLRLEDGRRVIDAMTTPAPLGHRHPRIVKAVTEAAKSSTTLDEGWSTSMRETAADLVLGTALADEPWAAGVRFALTGSEANDLALSLCQALTGRAPLVVRERAYHGMVGLARDATVQPQWHGGLSSKSGSVRPAPPAAEIRVLPFPSSSFGEGVEFSEEEAESALVSADSELTDAAAVIVDYTQGGHYANPAYQDVLARKAGRAGVPWIADEVITGFGKSGGLWFNFQRGNERPDLVTLGKPLGGGLLPVAGIVISQAVLDEIGDASWQNYSAMRSTDLGAAAAAEFIRVVDEDGLVDRADRLHELIVRNMRELDERHPSVTRIDGRGLHWWIELGDHDWRTWTGVSTDAGIADLVSKRTLEAGALVATSAERNVILMTLAMIVEDDEVQKVFDALDEGLALADRVIYKVRNVSVL